MLVQTEAVCLQDLAAVREGQDSLHISVFCGQRGSDGALGRRGQQDAGAHGTHDEGLLAGMQLIIVLFIHRTLHAFFITTNQQNVLQGSS